MSKFTTWEAPKAIWPYSKSYKAWNFVFCSGQIPLVSTTMKLAEWWIEAQTIQVCRNLWEVLREQKLSLKDVVKTTIFLTDLSNFDKVNDIYKDYFINKPARSTVEVSALPKWALIEIEAIAYINKND